MQESLDAATQAANWFQNFLKHGSAVSFLLSLMFGWGLSVIASFPIHWNVKDAERATFYARLVCIVGSFAITAATWPNEFRWAWAGTMGVMSPLLGLVVLWQLEKRAPGLHAYLTMKKPKGDTP
jgi:hypothetical protein